MKNPGDFALRAAGLTRKLRAVCGVVLSYLVIFSLSARAWAQPAFLRKDIQVAGQYAGFQIQVRSGSVASGDYNGDSRPDLVLSSFWGIDVLLNTGGGNFGEPVHTECAGFCGPLVAADFNGDGKLDLVIPNPSSLIGHILFGRGDGSFSPPREIPGAGLATTGDVNNDGKADLVVNDGVSLLVRLGNGDGTFQSGVMLSRGPALSETNNLAIADFDGDGHADLVVSSGNARAASPHYAVSVFLGQGDGTFQPPISTPVGAATLLVADLNSDGLPDLITGFDILFGKGDGSFQLPRPYFSPESVVDLPAPFAAVDFDGDGLLDLAVGSC